MQVAHIPAVAGVARQPGSAAAAAPAAVTPSSGMRRGLLLQHFHAACLLYESRNSIMQSCGCMTAPEDLQTQENTVLQCAVSEQEHFALIAAAATAADQVTVMTRVMMTPQSACSAAQCCPALRPPCSMTQHSMALT